MDQAGDVIGLEILCDNHSLLVPINRHDAVGEGAWENPRLTESSGQLIYHRDVAAQRLGELATFHYNVMDVRVQDLH
jgi:hypothetical protein